MAFSKSGMSGKKHGEGFLGMSIKVTPCLSGVRQSELSKQRQARVMDRGKVTRGMRTGHAGVVLAKRDVTAVMKAGFDLSVGTFQN